MNLSNFVEYYRSHILRFVCVLLAVVLPKIGASAGADGWSAHVGNAQHTGLSTTASQPFDVIHWAVSVDLVLPSNGTAVHYGSPLVTPGNTVIVPVKNGKSDRFMIKAIHAQDGSLVWSQ